MSTPSDPLVSTAWLADHLDAPDVRVVDASWHMPAAQRDPAKEFLAAHIPGAVFFDIDEIADETSDLPHMIPTAAKFAARVRKLGLGDGSRIVVYDSQGILPAARVWWHFRAMGHEDVVVLDGGLPKWIAEGRPVEDGPAAPQERHFTPRWQADIYRSVDQMRDIVASGREQIIDARAAGRFEGKDPEPRAGLRGGHMPGARNIPLSAMLASDNTMLPADQLKIVFEKAGVDIDKPIVSTCGSGITASVVALALARLGKPRSAVYDGSWTEWGGLSDTPVATGPAA
ncbi:3-mercaptopyruvate sulfurtransferase [Caulobacter vibrioides]|jgi:thiosulfate/3-mercaptopyruvate sulfurtransferase|uniref:3-mercaptopyruvate sulfurtransferase n=1 Tax=Caulobacter vibrioides OR37 TaxID=1292034 RepID=R0EPV7_CAUVI|nr:3-mercaptopyruvate sulfurtransferase [Caulobacter vibrioides]ENZ83879.1 rhodanese-related sulfurtransferase [Caulobacter vibrioides OR37]